MANYAWANPNIGFGQGSGGRFSQLAGTYKNTRQEREMQTAMEVMSGAEPQDNRTAIDKLLGDRDEWSAPSKNQAMSTLYRLNPQAAQYFQRQKDAAAAAEAKKLQQQAKDIKDFAPVADNLAASLYDISDPKERARKMTLAIPMFKKAFPHRKFDDMEKRLKDGLSDDELDDFADMWSPMLDKQGTSEFERLLKSSDYSSEQKAHIRKLRISSIASGDGFSIISDGKGGFTMTKGPGGMTAVQEGKARADYINKEISARKFVSLSNKMIDRLADAGEANPKLGITGAIAKFGDEIAATWRNLQALGISVEEGTSMNLDDYDLGKIETLASENAAFKTNVLSLALIYASAAGLGEGRALTDKDLQRAINAIGGSTNSAAQFRARNRELQDFLDMGLRVESRVRGYEGYESIIEQRTEVPTITTQEEYDALPSGAQFKEDGITYRKP